MTTNDGNGLRALKILYWCRELSAGIHYCNSVAGDQFVEAFIADDAGVNRLLNSQRALVNDEIAQIAALVLSKIDSFDFQTTATATSSVLLSRLQRWVYGADSTEQTMHQALLSGTFQQAEAACDICLATLLDCVSPATCFSLLTLGDSFNCGRLVSAAKQCALNNFEEAISQDRHGLKLLPESLLIDVATSDDMVVTSEINVFRGLSAWVEASLSTRLDRFADLMVRCLRFSQMGMEQLTEILDGNALVAQDSKALEVGAHAVIQHHMGIEPETVMFGRAINLAARKWKQPRQQEDEEEIRNELSRKVELLFLPEQLQKWEMRLYSSSNSGGSEKGSVGVEVSLAEERILSPSKLIQVEIDATVQGLPTQRALF